jgi:hypothetical protein
MLLPVLDVAIGIVFVFLLFSLVVTALNEVVLSKLDLRARFLKEGLSELLQSSSKTAEGKLAIRLHDFFQHGLISSLSRSKYDPKAKGTKGVPSYIPGKSFVLTLLSLVTEGKDPDRIPDMRAQIEEIGNDPLKKTLLALYDDAAGDLDHFKANLENWFNESMDRVGGWYKRYAQQCLLAFSFLLAVACNVDSIRIIQSLSTDSKLRESLVNQAAKFSDAQPPEVPATEKLRNFKDALAELGGAGLPIGWNDSSGQRLIQGLPQPQDALSVKFWQGNLFTHQTLGVASLWFTAFTGWMITALAASFGAPFWFDTLNRFIDIRGVGRAPEEKDSTAPKKKSTGKESYIVTGDSEKKSS